MTSRLAVRTIQLGALAVVLAASTLRLFDLDRFFVPKELVLHVVALLAGLLVAGAMRRTATTRTDLLLLTFLLLSAASAAMATNRWAAMRALAISASGIVLYQAARTLPRRRIVHGLAFAIVLACATSLLQAYGARLEVFAMTRVPGGTLGNRNFVAHAAAFGFPLVLLTVLGARTRRGYLWGGLGAAAVVATLVLTRSRGGWLAFAFVVLVMLLSMLVAPRLRRDGRTWLRFAGILVFAAGGVAAALLLPNALHWRSDNPYAETARSVTNYREGSGHGRVIQYTRSMLMAARHPLFGVGPGNWPVVYPAHVPRNDPSLDESQPGMTSNPWPSSDWIAFISERGLAAAVVLAMALLGIVMTGLRSMRVAAESDDALASAALIATVAGACVAGAFDAVLLLPLPAFVVWTALGALAGGDVPAPPRHRVTLATVTLLAVALLGAARSAAQLVAMEMLVARGDRASLEQAAKIDPGNFRLQMRLASRCEHAKAARALFPNADVAKAAARRCR